jgi:hypothetical protein
MLLVKSLRRPSGAAIALGAALALSGYYAFAADKDAEKPSAKSDAKSKDSTDPSKYIRTSRNGKNRVIGLDTAIVSFRPASPKADDVLVDLVAAVHVADKGYYEELNKRFKDYDVVLYELVAPRGTRVPKGGRKDNSGNPISSLQVGMKNVLELDYQLDQIDYTRRNFLHADLSPDELLKLMHNHVPGFGDIITQIVELSVAQEAKDQVDSAVALAFAMFDKNRPRALKRIAAAQFEDGDSSIAALDGLIGSTLIGERNKRALEVLGRQIWLGRKKIAIFYGGGHMTDMEKHLRADFSLKPVKTEWLRAWDMK